MATEFYISETGTITTPKSPNAAYTRLPLILTSSFEVFPPQYQYVLDIYESGSSEIISRLTQDYLREGSYNSIVFDPSRIFQGELDYDYNWKVTGSIAPVNSVKTFIAKSGEQYGTSPSSSVTVYPDQDTFDITVFPGVVNPLEPEYGYRPSYNFNTSSFDYDPTIPSEPDRSQYLTNQPSNKEWTFEYGNELYMNSEDYFTVTQLKDTLLTGSNNVVGWYYDGTNITPVVSEGFPFTGSGEFYTFGLGPKNLSNLSTEWADLIASGSVNFISTNSDGGNISYWIKDKLVSDTTYTGPVPCNDEYTRFAFINRYGFWDYYNIYNPVKTTTDLDRKTYNPTQLNYGYALQARDYRNSSFQRSVYYTKIKDTFSIDTDYINKETANWLEELLESPEVYLQQGSEFVPIVLTNTSFVNNNSTSRNKLFKYTIEWVYANPRRSRL